MDHHSQRGMPSRTGAQMTVAPRCVYLTDTGGSMSAMIQAHHEAGRNVKPHLAGCAGSYEPQLIARTTSQLADPLLQRDFISSLQHADIVILELHSGPNSCPGWQTWIKPKTLHIQAPLGSAAAQTEAAELSTIQAHTWKQCQDFIGQGTLPNYRAAWLTLLRAHHGLVSHDETPLDVPAHAEYHPIKEGVSHAHIQGSVYRPVSVAGSEPSNTDSAAPAAVVGIWFSRMDFVRGNVDHIDALVQSLSAAGHRVKAVYGEKFTPATQEHTDHILAHHFQGADSDRLDVLINVHPLSLSLRDVDVSKIYSQLNVPVFQAYCTNQTTESWKTSNAGLTTREISTLCAQPEFDGLLAGAVIATKSDTIDPCTGAQLAGWVPNLDGIAQLTDRVTRHAAMTTTPPGQRRLAVIFHHHPPRMDQIGCATGLDTFASAVQLLRGLQARGYDIGCSVPTASELAERFIATVSAQQQWLSPQQLIQRAHDVVTAEDIEAHLGDLPETVRDYQTASWGNPPGEVFSHDGQLAISGLRFGNVFLSLGPPRGVLEKLRNEDVHDPTIVPPYHYLEHYRWLRETFKAHAIINLGTHGTTEWLPGKATGLSRECYPQIVQANLPNIHPYIVNNPGEATAAKRRTGATLIGHLPAPTRDAGLTTDVAVIEQAVADFHDAVTHSEGAQRAVAEKLWAIVEDAGLDTDFGLSREAALADIQHFVEHVHHGLLDLADNQINDGLHTLGYVDRERLPATLAQLLRQPGTVPSLRDELLRAAGHNPTDVADTWDHHATQLANQEAVEFCRCILNELPLPVTTPVLERIAGYARQELIPALTATTNELEQIFAALDGHYIEPGPSGAPQRGNHNVLPTGRNFYSLDPHTLPTPSAWDAGVQLAETLLDKYRRVQSHAAKHAAPEPKKVEEVGDVQLQPEEKNTDPVEPEWPRSVGLTLWGTATMRSRGEDVAQVLHLMGLKPRWSEAGLVTGLDVVPLEVLGRPRIDVTLRISGFFRDAFGHLIELLDDAVQLVAALQEPLEHNLLRAHVLLDAQRYAATGVDQDKAWTRASWRVFGPPPNVYGTGVSDLIQEQRDPDRATVAATYIDTSRVAHSRHGTHDAADHFKQLLSRVDVTTRTTDTREYDLLASQDAYSEQGGMAAAITEQSGRAPLDLSADSSNPRDIRQRTVAADLRLAIRTKLLNPSWREGLQRHGYAGAAEITRTVEAVAGWVHTTAAVDQTLLTRIAEEVILGDEAQAWMDECNPAARQVMLAAFDSLRRTQAWQAPEHLVHELREAYLAREGELEDQLDVSAPTTDRTFS